MGPSQLVVCHYTPLRTFLPSERVARAGRSPPNRPCGIITGVDIIATVQLLNRRYGLFRPGETVLVGVSGGPDSLCLLHVLRSLAPELTLALHVAHLHHGLRGADADADAAFVQHTAAGWGLPCTVERVNVAALAAVPGVSLEEAARTARYRFFRRLAGQLGATAIAVGHNADDQTETVLMHFLRGSGLAGLRGMSLVTPLAAYRLEPRDAGAGLSRAQQDEWSAAAPGQDEPEREDDRVASPATVRLIRPLLSIPRADILAYCDAHGLQPRFDRSNEDTTFFRNRLRHELLPLLEQFNPQVRRVLRRTAAVVADDYALLRDQLAATWPTLLSEETPDRLTFDLASWRALPTSLQRSVLREAIHRLRHSLRNIDAVHVENALWALREGHTGTRMTLPNGLELVLGYTRFAVGDQGVALPTGDVPQLRLPRLPVAVPGVTELDDEAGWQLAAELLPPDHLPTDWQHNADRWQAWLDADALGPRPALRSRAPGDRFQPLSMAGHAVLLGEFFTNAKIPAAVRDRWPLLVTAGDSIAWVCGLRVDERAKVTEATGRVVHLRLHRAP